ncbi:MAG TPA: hypothetical protein DCP20_00340 [Coriobacteriia bacterium]|nr:hypothetical protein [Coriobacteriia bacterium]
MQALDLLNGAAVWLVASFVLAGAIHEFVSPAKFQRLLGSTKLSALLRATVSGMLLPLCSCGVVPLGLSLYYSGAYLGPTLAFMAATPIINPAAFILAYGLLGPKLATAYLACGFLLPMLIGWIANRAGGAELHRPGPAFQGVAAAEAADRQPLSRRLASGIVWGFTDLGVMVSRYVVLGMLIAGLIFAVVPASIVQGYLGDPGVISIFGAAVLGAMMYVCAVGHIPFVAALVAAGAAPGLALTFLLSGAATNLPELISINRLIGKRAMVIYSASLVLASFVAGYAVNLLIGPGFVPVLDASRTGAAIGVANWFILEVPPAVAYACTAIVVALWAVAAYRSLVKRLAMRFPERAGEVV